jgi:phage-related protein
LSGCSCRTEEAVREFLAELDDDAAAKVVAMIDRLGQYGTRMPGKFVTKLTGDIFELRVKHFDRIFRVLFFFQPGRLIVLASGFQKQTQKTPQGEIARGEQLRALWLKYRNRYPASERARAKIREQERL